MTSKASGCSVGSKISLADIQLYYFVTQFFDDKEGSLKACDHCPHIKAIIAAVSANEKVTITSPPRPTTYPRPLFHPTSKPPSASRGCIRVSVACA